MSHQFQSSSNSTNSVRSSSSVNRISKTVTEELPSPEELREAYNRYCQIEIEERDLSKNLKKLREAKFGLRVNFMRYMEMTETPKLAIRGCANSLELVDAKRYESLSKDVIQKRIIEFFTNSDGKEISYRNSSPQEQCELLIQSVFHKKTFTTIRKFKHTVDKERLRVQKAIEEASQSTQQTPSQPQFVNRRIRRKE